MTYNNGIGTRAVRDNGVEAGVRAIQQEQEAHRYDGELQLAALTNRARDVARQQAEARRLAGSVRAANAALTQLGVRPIDTVPQAGGWAPAVEASSWDMGNQRGEAPMPVDEDALARGTQLAKEHHAEWVGQASYLVQLGAKDAMNEAIAAGQRPTGIPAPSPIVSGDASNLY